MHIPLAPEWTFTHPPNEFEKIFSQDSRPIPVPPIVSRLPHRGLKNLERQMSADASI